MLDIREMREHPDRVRERLQTRGGYLGDVVGDILALDEKRRAAVSDADQKKAQRKSASKEIGELMARRETEAAEARKAAVRALGDEITALDRFITELEAERDGLLLTLPNLPQTTVPLGGGSQDNVVVRTHGQPVVPDFTPRNHVELCETLGLVDFSRGTKLSGSGFLLYTGWGARLERALIQFLLDLHTREHGYTEVSPPFLVSEACMEGVGQFPKFRDQAYAVREGLDDTTLGKLYLIPTAEAPVANIHREELLSEAQLPIRYCAYSPCFRAEAGAAGLGTRGMIRVHQFDKVELIQVVAPEKSEEALESMVRHAERVLQDLELSYHVLCLCTGDMGFASAKTYDIEVWAPGQGQYLEVSSCSNCEAFQSRRMQMRYKTESGENRWPHLLNGSGTALARLFVALLETHQQADGSVRIPEKLQPYLGADRIPVPS
jgi:seryl-tRNA synthetase